MLAFTPPAYIDLIHPQPPSLSAVFSCPLSSLSSSPACVILLCDHRGAPACHPVLDAAGRTGEWRARRLTEIRLLIRRSDWVPWWLGFFLAGKDRGDRDTSGEAKPTAIRHTSAISDQPSVLQTGTRAAAPRLSMSFTPPRPNTPPRLNDQATTPPDGMWRYW